MFSLWLNINIWDCWDVANLSWTSFSSLLTLRAFLILKPIWVRIPYATMYSLELNSIWKRFKYWNLSTCVRYLHDITGDCAENWTKDTIVLSLIKMSSCSICMLNIFNRQALESLVTNSTKNMGHSEVPVMWLHNVRSSGANALANPCGADIWPWYLLYLITDSLRHSLYPFIIACNV